MIGHPSSPLRQNTIPTHIGGRLPRQNSKLNYLPVDTTLLMLFSAQLLPERRWDWLAEVQHGVL